MPDWRKIISRLGYSAEDRFDALRMRLRLRTGMMKGLQVLPFRTYGTANELWVKGRVLEDRGMRPSLESDRLWDNVLASYKRVNSSEVPFAKVRVTYGPHSVEITADQEGFFECRLPVADLPTDVNWHEVQCSLVQPAPDAHNPATAAARVLVPGAGARCGIISDIDDTIIVTNARSLFKMAYATFVRNARGRVAFPGVGAFYSALQEGISGEENNPVFYVSSGPWNLYDLLCDFMELNRIPAGPILLQDYGTSRGQVLKKSHFAHKTEEIQRLLSAYPHLPFILIGDSGQHDPEIYTEVLKRVPNRIRAIYIRDVTDAARSKEIEALREEVAKHGGELLLVRNTAAAAEHASQKGWIKPQSIDQVHADALLDKAAPEPPIEDDSPQKNR